ncbi:MAG: hypothetical protein HOL41_15570 [Rhodospirillaceae bacterium]|jgi:hypothetical protein|nr:hypothetical protein [Rhodospirillaceae bacterium]MBT6086189.1 hypothetical protein [Rhodospirillaceae bacterium]
MQSLQPSLADPPVLSEWRIAIVIQLPFSNADLTKYDIATLLRMGCHVDVIDASQIMHPNWVSSDTMFVPPDGVSIYVAASQADLGLVKDVLDRAEVTICSVSTGHINFQSLSLIQTISRSATPYFLIYRDAIPSIDQEITHKSIIQRLRQCQPMTSMLNRIPLSMLGIRRADGVIWGGDACRIATKMVGPSTTEIWGISQNYELYIRNVTALPNASNSETAVYLDQYFGFHPDSKTRGQCGILETDGYYRNLRRLFDRIEAELGIEVVIAAHPRSDYRAKPNLYGARQVIRGKSIDLVRQSKLTICAYSTAASFAVLFNKPLLVITTPEISNIRALPNAPEALARSIGKQAEDLSHPDSINLQDAMAINDLKYSEYLRRYVISERSSKKGIAAILCDFCSTRVEPHQADLVDQ